MSSTCSGCSWRSSERKKVEMKKTTISFNTVQEPLHRSTVIGGCSWLPPAQDTSFLNGNDNETFCETVAKKQTKKKQQKELLCTI